MWISLLIKCIVKFCTEPYQQQQCMEIIVLLNMASAPNSENINRKPRSRTVSVKCMWIARVHCSIFQVGGEIYKWMVVIKRNTVSDRGVTIFDFESDRPRCGACVCVLARVIQSNQTRNEVKRPWKMSICVWIRYKMRWTNSLHTHDKTEVVVAAAARGSLFDTLFTSITLAVMCAYLNLLTFKALRRFYYIIIMITIINTISKRHEINPIYRCNSLISISWLCF